MDHDLYMPFKGVIWGFVFGLIGWAVIIAIGCWVWC